MNTIQKQTGIPTVFVEATLDTFPQAYRTLGKILGKEEAGEILAAYVEDTAREARANAALIPDSEKLSVYYGTGSAGLNANASGSIQSDVIDVIGAVNAIQVPEDEITNSGGGTLVNMEELYMADRTMILRKNPAAGRDLTLSNPAAIMKFRICLTAGSADRRQ